MVEYIIEVRCEAAKQSEAPDSPRCTHTTSGIRYTAVIEAKLEAPMSVLTERAYRRLSAQVGLIAQAAGMKSRRFETSQTTFK